jgi:hypothetical protein
MDLNEDQKRRLLTTFEHIDMLLDDIEQVFTTPRSSRLYRPYIPDVSPERQHQLEQGISEFRALMSEVLNRLSIPIRPPHISAFSAAHTSLILADVDLEELKSGYMRGYGKLTQDSATELDRMLLEMQKAISGTKELLSGHSDGKRRENAGKEET